MTQKNAELVSFLKTVAGNASEKTIEAHTQGLAKIALQLLDENYGRMKDVVAVDNARRSIRVARATMTERETLALERKLCAKEIFDAQPESVRALLEKKKAEKKPAMTEEQLKELLKGIIGQ